LGSSHWQFLRLKELLGRVDVPVVWVARVKARDSDRWRDFWLPDAATGAPRRDNIVLDVAGHLLPRPPEELDLAEHQGFPFWEHDHGVERVCLADQILAALRRHLPPDEYRMWERVLSLDPDLGHGKLVLNLGKICTPGADGVNGFTRTFRHGDRFLNVHLSGAVSAVSAVSAVADKETRFDHFNVASNRVQANQDVSRTGRFGLTGLVRAWRHRLQLSDKPVWDQRGGGLAHAGGGGGGSWGRRRAGLREVRFWDQRAFRVQGGEQVYQVDLDVAVTGSFGRDGEPARTFDEVVCGYANVRLRTSAVQDMKLSPQQIAERDAKAVAQFATDWLAEQAEQGVQVAGADPSAGTLTWWTPQLGGDVGIGFGSVQKLGGLDRLYDQWAAQLVALGLLPPAAWPQAVAGRARPTPWQHLQTLPRDGSVLNRAGVQYSNWRNLVNAVRDDTMPIWIVT
jgi:hypothetical protein